MAENRVKLVLGTGGVGDGRRWGSTKAKVMSNTEGKNNERTGEMGWMEAEVRRKGGGGR